jgi:MFS superfamily sulfate permease-like transporter
MSNILKNKDIPFDGIKGLKQHFSSDSLSGFLVFMLALPLSLGIATASDFPAIYGLITAMVGGVVVSFFAGSPLTIKGPAAGLIVIVAGSVAELGKGNNELGWKLALGAIVIAGIIQVLFGVLKLGALSDFFPLSAIHGMLAAIGIIIISKQLHILVGINPLTPEGKPMVEPLELLMELKNTFVHFFEHEEVAIVGLVSLVIVFGWPMIPVKALKKIPSALVVLLVSIPLALALGIQNVPDVKDSTGEVVKGFSPLLSFKEGLFDVLGVKVSFQGFSMPLVFIKFVIMFALIGSLESLLTVKAIDMLDPYKRKSNYNKDLVALGIGNIVAGILGGLPMITEVARSTANINYGGKTRWANFFHGFFILLFLLFAVSFSDIIPKASLAAILIGVGWKLAHPREFGHRAKIGADQIVVFIITILLTLATDLLVGIGAGILLKFILHISRNVPLKRLFMPNFKVSGHTIYIEEAAIFSNFIPVKKKILSFPYSSHLTLDVTKCYLVDHTVIETLHHLKDDFTNEGGTLEIKGIEEFKAVGNSKHQMATVRKKK